MAWPITETSSDEGESKLDRGRWLEEGKSLMELNDGIKALIDGPNFAHLATLMADGSPQVAPVWVAREGDRILVGTGEGTLKARNTQRDPRVALSILDFENPYVEAQLRGRIVERRNDQSLKGMDTISRKYTSKAFPFRNPEGRVILVIEVDRARFANLPFEHTPRHP
ncbi:MAG TPA: PPOX class F420-dependent oxidoreductase [Vicinamibacteria bacterium]|nr:PPOX class F420-dependent oxidoreductase [Vicinamibacteria bacterium]